MIAGRARSITRMSILAMWVMASFAGAARAQAPAVAPEATRILKRMTDYVGGLKSFSLDTQNSLEEVLDSGQKIQHDFSSTVVIRRPDRLRAERTGDTGSQLLVYDGKTLTIFDSDHSTWASIAAPADLDATLHFARDSLDLVPPAGDIVFTNAYELLTANLTSGSVIGKATIGGVECDQLAFRSPGVDWQIWIAEGDKPLPQKYVLTTTGDPAQPQFVTLMNGWNVSPKSDDAMFSFTAPRGAKQTEFLRIDKNAAAGR